MTTRIELLDGEIREALVEDNSGGWLEGEEPVTALDELIGLAKALETAFKTEVRVCQARTTMLDTIRAAANPIAALTCFTCYGNLKIVCHCDGQHCRCIDVGDPCDSCKGTGSRYPDLKLALALGVKKTGASA